MKTESLLLLVEFQCPPEIEKEFNEWHDEHVSLMLKFPGMKGATRYKRNGANEEYPNYLALYEFENEQAFKKYETSPERDVVLKRTDEWWPEGVPYKRGLRATYKAIKTWKK